MSSTRHRTRLHHPFPIIAGLLALTATPFVAASDADLDRTEEAGACRRIAERLVATQLASHPIPLGQRTTESTSLWDGLFSSKDEAPRSVAEGAPAPAAPAPAALGAAEDSGRAPVERSSMRKADKTQGGKMGRGTRQSAKSSGPASYSRTNTQELSVDEGDIVKTDGRHVYHLSCNRNGAASGCRNELRIYASWPASRTRLLARYAVPTLGPSTNVKQIYLYGDKIALLAHEQSPHGARSTGEAMRTPAHLRSPFAGTVARLMLLDVADRKSPRLLREVVVDGAFIDSRMIGSRLFLATTSPALQLPPSMAAEIQTIGTALASEGVVPTTEAIMPRLEDRWSHFINQDPGLPRTRELLGRRASADSEPIYGCADLDADDAMPGSQVLNLVQLDLDGHTAPNGSGLAGYTTQSTVYASEGAFYLADPIHNYQTFSGRGWSSATLVRKFDLGGKNGKPVFAARGMVRGHLLNQFSMSEHEGDLRVATSDNWASNNLYVLRAGGKTLETIGTLENLGRNERIYAVRMMGKKGYVVTFRRTDPLYTLDLSNPYRPALVGALHIDGYSNYLHPLGDDHLLAVGQDADSRGQALGFHLQIFDVSDAAHPVRKFHEKLDARSNSIAQNDHHAFMYEPSTQTLAVPWKGENYWGLIAYKVDTSRGFTNLGRVNHALMYKSYFTRECGSNRSGDCGKRNHWWTFFTRQSLEIDRVIAIDNSLYSLSPSGLMVHRVGKRLRQQASVLVSEPSWGVPRSRAVAVRE